MVLAFSENALGHGFAAGYSEPSTLFRFLEDFSELVVPDLLYSGDSKYADDLASPTDRHSLLLVFRRRPSDYEKV